MDDVRRSRSRTTGANSVHEQPRQAFADATGLLVTPGTCHVCGQYADERMTVALVHGMSGPGWARYGCLPCTRLLVASRFAPTWLREDLARVEETKP